jgi:predicted alpha/beta-hydrolase family hydrolase
MPRPDAGPARIVFLTDGPRDAAATVLLAHGAGAPMDSRAMTAIAEAFAAHGLRTARFEFGYMAARRAGQRRPPPRAETLIDEYRTAVGALDAGAPLIVGGKSMGGRVASLAADEMHAEGRVHGLLCLGYPFHPPGRPEQTRTAHLDRLRVPTRIFQGTRDRLGSPEEVAGYVLSPAITVTWIEDGDHDLKPRKRVTGRTLDDNLDSVGAAVAAWVRGL